MLVPYSFVCSSMSHVDGMDFIFDGLTIVLLNHNANKQLENYLFPHAFNIVKSKSDNKMIINYGSGKNVFFLLRVKNELI